MILEVIFLIIGAVGIYEGVRLTHTTLLYADAFGPGWYLFLMACLLFGCAMALSVRRFIRRKRAQLEGSISMHKNAVGRAFLLLLLYGVSIMYVGYAVGSVVFFTVAQRIFGERSWARSTAIGVVITACFYIVFVYLAAVPLP